MSALDEVPSDFDFQVGSWQVSHRRLKARLCGCDDWEVFSGTSEMRRVLGGRGNVEDNVLHMRVDPCARLPCAIMTRLRAPGRFGGFRPPSRMCWMCR